MSRQPMAILGSLPSRTGNEPMTQTENHDDSHTCGIDRDPEEEIPEG